MNTRVLLRLSSTLLYSTHNIFRILYSTRVPSFSTHDELWWGRIIGDDTFGQIFINRAGQHFFVVKGGEGIKRSVKKG